MSSIDNHLAPAILGTAYAFIVLCTLAVALRFTARHVKGAHYKSDDWTMLGAYALFILTMGFELEAMTALAKIEHGYQDPDYPRYENYIYMCGAPYCASMCVLQISVVLFYRRIFTTKWFKNVSMAFVFVNILWGIPAVLVSIWICNPISSLWKSTTPSCIQYGTFWVIMSTFELLIQTCMMVLPVNEVRKLQLTTARKVSVSVIFMLGGSAIITGIVRIAVSYQGPLAFALDIDALWLNVHLGVAMISACLPTYKPLVTLATNKAKSYYSQITGSKIASSSGSSRGYKASSSGAQHGRALEANKGSLEDWASLNSIGHNDGDDVELGNSEVYKTKPNASTV